MRAFSVGFENKVVEFDQENDTIILKENELYEISCVNVPANAMALAKTKGINTQSIEELEKYTQYSYIDIDKLAKSICETLRRDNAINLKAETPISKGAFSAKEINRAIRLLLKKKKIYHNQ